MAASNVSFAAVVRDIAQGPAFIYWNAPKPPDTKRLLVTTAGAINIATPPAGNVWAATTAYAVGQNVVDTVTTGYIMECTVAGTSGSSIPTWPAVGAAVVDGTATWVNRGLCISLGSSQGATNINFNDTIEDVMIDQETGPVDAIITQQKSTITCTLMESQYAKIGLSIPGSTTSSGTDTGLPASHQTYEQVVAGGLIQVPQLSVVVVSPRRDMANAYSVAQLYAAYTNASFAYDVTRSKESVYKVTFTGISQLWRTQGDRMFSAYRQTA